MVTSRTITTEHLRRVFRDGRLITMPEVQALHNGVTRQAIQQRVASGSLPPALGQVAGINVWDREEVLDYMIRRR